MLYVITDATGAKQLFLFGTTGKVITGSSLIGWSPPSLGCSAPLQCSSLVQGDFTIAPPITIIY